MTCIQCKEGYKLQPLIFHSSATLLCYVFSVWYARDKDKYLLKLPYVSGYEARLGLYCKNWFNHKLEQGLVWFEPVNHGSKRQVLVCFDDQFVDSDDKEGGGYYEMYNRQPIRVPSDPIKLRSWPDDVVFDLHRLIWRPYKLWQNEKKPEKKRRPQKRKEPEPGDSSLPLEEQLGETTEQAAKKQEV
jgi:hypothetical protein